MEISVVIHTLNSEKLIRQCLESVKDFDEIIICDMHSTDNTLAIAGEYGCTIVMHEPTNGIPEPARTFAVEQATKDWVLVVDSDEVVKPGLKTYLYDFINAGESPDALWIARNNYFMGRFMHAAFPDYQLRFFRRSSFVTWPVTIHSRPKINGSSGKAPRKKALAFDHLEDGSISNLVSKINRYSDREVERRNDEKVNIAELLLKPAYRFLQLYLFKGGFLDGRAGLIHATFKAYYQYMTLAKMTEDKQINPV
ncbi:glycosyl transferase family 2 [Bacteroidia bacterium]|nr:glycosyl transferase family 2 [Bacteroidia bacterium]